MQDQINKGAIDPSFKDNEAEKMALQRAEVNY